MSKVFKAVIGGVGSLFGGLSTPAAPEVKPPAPAPDPDDPRLRTLARRRAAERSQGTGSREGTRLTNGTFSSSQL